MQLFYIRLYSVSLISFSTGSFQAIVIACTKTMNNLLDYAVGYFILVWNRLCNQFDTDYKITGINRRTDNEHETCVGYVVFLFEQSDLSGSVGSDE